jgi:hypothetical protein
MRKVTLIMLLLLVGCGSLRKFKSGPPPKKFIKGNLINKIPENADRVIVISNADSLFHKVKLALVQNDFRIDDSDKSTKSITTEGKDIGKSTVVRYTIFIKGTKIVGTAGWMPGASKKATTELLTGALTGISTNPNTGWRKAEWKKGRYKSAFASLVGLLQKIPHTKIKFKKD